MKPETIFEIKEALTLFNDLLKDLVNDTSIDSLVVLLATDRIQTNNELLKELDKN